MATTGVTILNNALALMDEEGATEYDTKALNIINMLCGELYRFSDTYEITSAGTRPVLTPISALTSSVGVDDYLAQSVLPYGLAAQLMLGSEDVKAGFFQQRYEELMAHATIPTETEDIVDLYGILPTSDEVV